MDDCGTALINIYSSTTLETCSHFSRLKTQQDGGFSQCDSDLHQFCLIKVELEVLIYFSTMFHFSDDLE